MDRRSRQLKTQFLNRTPAPARADRRYQEIIGLLFVFLGMGGFICLQWHSAPLPNLVHFILTMLVGWWAWFIPLLALTFGIFMMRGIERVSLSQRWTGFTIVFFVLVTGTHLKDARDTVAWNRILQPAAWQHAPESGGMVGLIFGSALYTIAGSHLSLLFLSFVAVGGVVMMADKPIGDLLQHSGTWLTRAMRKAGLDIGISEGDDSGFEEHSEADTVASVSGEMGRSKRDRQLRVVNRALNPDALLLKDVEPAEPAGLRGMWSNLTSRITGKRSDPEGSEDESVPAAPQLEEKPSEDVSEDLDRTVIVARRRTKLTADSTDVNDAADLISISHNGASQATLPLFAMPPMSLLDKAPPAVSNRSQDELSNNIGVIEETLRQFNIEATVDEVASGPTVTRYEIKLAGGIKVNKITSLADNLAMSLAAIDVRVEAPIPGKSAIGVEVPNANPVTVTLRECLETEEFKNAPSKLTIALGKDVSGNYRYADLTKMPHLLIGGSTNSGKSVCLNTIIASLVYQATPREVKMLMIDPKRVELSLWDGIPHLEHPVVKDVKQAAGLFRAALREMDRRYDLFAAMGTRNLDGYNSRVPEAERMPYIVLIVDELADLMLQQGAEVETSICRLAQLARATGIHLVIATQRPSVDIITGTIKANISSRIAFAVASQVDSRTILDCAGADRLVGKGDMLFMPIDASKPVRIQGAYLSEKETHALVEYLKAQEKPAFGMTVGDTTDRSMNSSAGSHDDDDEMDDQFLEQAVRLVVNNGSASTSMLQRRFRIGYTRAARIVEKMEEKGIVGPLNGAKPREILISKDDVERMFNPGGALPSVASYQD